MFKRILSAVAALLIVASTGNYTSSVQYVKTPLTASADDGEAGTYENIRYKKYADHVTIITTNKKSVESLEIPAEIEELPVTEIADFAFEGCGMTEVKLPDTIEKIGEYAFFNCSKLTSIWIPENVKTIDSFTFAECNMLSDVVIYSNVTEIKDGAFMDCISLDWLIIPKSVAYIGEYAFAGCEGLEKITILNPECEIYDAKDTISNSSYGSKEVRYDGLICGALNSTVRSYAEKYGYTFDIAFEPDTDYSDQKLTLRRYEDHVTVVNCDTSAKSVVIPSVDYKGRPITEIEPMAFYNCSELTSVTMPDTVNKIGDMAFEGCTKLSEIYIPDGVTEIADRTFANCEYLDEVIIPKSVTKIGERAFSECYRLDKLIILNPDCEIYDEPDTITNAYYEAGTVIQFGGYICSYEDSAVQAYAERYRRNFKSFNDTGDLVYKNLYYKVASDHVVITGCDRSAEIIDIPANIGGLPVTEIDAMAFYKKSTITSVTISDTVTDIGSMAFAECSGLTEISLPNNLTEIPEGAFNNCASLEEIIIPYSVKKINGHAFENCKNLAKITILNPECVIKDAADTISNLAYTETAPLFSGCICGYENSTAQTYAEKYKRKFEALDGEGEYIYKDLTYKIVSDHVVITGYKGSVYTLAIPDTIVGLPVTEIGEGAFRQCDSVKEIIVPKSVTKINKYGFRECYKLEKITILNPKCEIYDDINTISDSFLNGGAYIFFAGVIRGYANSTAQAFAEKYNRKFEALEGDNATMAGDANCDGVVSIADATAILQHLGNKDKYALTAQGEKNADVAEPSGITANDAIAIQKLDAGLIEKLPE